MIQINRNESPRVSYESNDAEVNNVAEKEVKLVDYCLLRNPIGLHSL